MARISAGDFEHRLEAVEAALGFTDELSKSSERLVGSVQGVSTLLADIKALQEESTANKKTAGNAAIAVVASEKKFRKRTRLLALFAVLVSVGSAYWVYDKVSDKNHDDALIRYSQCQQRNEQVAQTLKQSQDGLKYGVRVFRILRKDDPQLANDIASIPPPKSGPIPTPVRCVKP